MSNLTGQHCKQETPNMGNMGKVVRTENNRNRRGSWRDWGPGSEPTVLNRDQGPSCFPTAGAGGPATERRLWPRVRCLIRVRKQQKLKEPTIGPTGAGSCRGPDAQSEGFSIDMKTASVKSE